MGYPTHFGTESAFPIWHKLTGKLEMDPSHLTLSMVQHPVLRLTLKLFATTIFGRADHSLSRMNELQFLGVALAPDEPREFQDFTCAIVNHLSWVSNAAKSAAIWVGGILTHIAVFHGFEEPNELPSDTLMTHIFLRNCFYMGPIQDQTWYYTEPGGPQHTLVLPTQNLPPIQPNMEHYLLPIDLLDNIGEDDPNFVPEEEEEYVDSESGGEGPSSVPHAGGYPYPDFQQQMQQILTGQQAQNELLQSLNTRVNTLQLGQNDLNNQMNTLRLGQEDLNARVARIEDENRRNWDRFFGGGWNQWQGGPGSGFGGQ